MSAKPTPGPYMVIEDYGCFKVLAGNGLQWIHFYHGKSPSGKVVTADEAEANARAWVDGMDAMETLKRIRAIEREYSESRMNAVKCLQGIVNILDEANRDPRSGVLWPALH